MQPGHSRASAITLLAIAAVCMCAPVVLHAQYVLVTADAANIRTGPSTNFTVVVQALEDDIFTLQGTEGAWYEISMFSGEFRYLHTSLAEPTDSALDLPSDANVRRRAFVEIARAQDRAVREAERRYPTDYIRQIDLERLLYDRYELPILHRYGIPPAHHRTLVMDGVRSGWVPR